MGKLRFLLLVAFLTFYSLNTIAQEDITIFKKVDLGDHSFCMELLIKNPTREKLEGIINALVQKYGERKRLQIDIFDDLKALQKRIDNSYPSKLVYKHWLVSITDKKIYRFYVEERPDIK